MRKLSLLLVFISIAAKLSAQQYLDTILWVKAIDPSVFAIDGHEFTSNTNFNNTLQDFNVVFYENAFIRINNLNNPELLKIH